MRYVVGVDLGQAQDYTAKCFLQRELRETKQLDPNQGVWHEEHYWIRRLERPQLKTPYTDIVSELAQQMRNEKLGQDAELVVDATGAGRPVIDMMRAAGLNPIPVSITGGLHVTQNASDGFWHVPKKVLVSSLAVEMQCGRLHMVDTIPLAPIWQREAMAFRVRISKHAHDSYEAWREGEHDDLMLATALAIWWAGRTTSAGYAHTPKTAMMREAADRRRRYVQESNRPFWDRRGPKRFAR